MEEGSLRCDANVSLRPEGAEAFGTKVEIKNMNSIRSLERALAFEVERQTTALEAGEPIVQETRHWDEDSGTTRSMRSKEEAFDYRYFPEPDIPSLEPDAGWVRGLRAALPELPRARRARYESDLGLKPQVARVLVGSRSSSHLFEAAVALGSAPEKIANWVTQDVAALVNVSGADLADAKLGPEHLADLVRLVNDDTISGAGAKQALEEAFATGDPIEDIVDRHGLRQVSDTSALGAIADEVLAEHPDVVAKFRGGNQGVIGFLVGQMMQRSGGSANPKVAQELLRERLAG
jgi:aspartyl-tRNA(Asn)/glutamyl-tRNA(Gln) amidotransferase subunit B